MLPAGSTLVSPSDAVVGFRCVLVRRPRPARRPDRRVRRGREINTGQRFDIGEVRPMADDDEVTGLQIRPRAMEE